MYLNKPGISSVIKTQFNFKLRAYAGILIPLIVVQIMAFLFSLGGVGSTISSNISIKHISGDIILIFSLLYMLIAGINMGRNSVKKDLIFVSNRLTAHISNVLFLATASLIAGITATMCGIFLRVVMYFAYSDFIAANLNPLTLLSSVFVASLYALLISAVGYFSGALTIKNRIFIAILPALFIGLFMVPSGGQEPIPLLFLIVSFFSGEESPFLFIFKSLSVSALAFGSVILISNRTEVKE